MRHDCTQNIRTEYGTKQWSLHDTITQKCRIVVYVRGCTPVKIFFQAVPSQSFPQCTLTDGCKGGGYGFNVGALLQGWRLCFQCRRVVLRVGTVVNADFSAKIPHFSAKLKIFLQTVKDAERAHFARI